MKPKVTNKRKLMDTDDSVVVPEGQGVGRKV